jgi:hypothetical protein
LTVTPLTALFEALYVVAPTAPPEYFATKRQLPLNAGLKLYVKAPPTTRTEVEPAAFHFFATRRVMTMVTLPGAAEGETVPVSLSDFFTLTLAGPEILVVVAMGSVTGCCCGE